jgi:DNA-binding winged helix-turn-helix (wHTH) protein
LSTVPDAQPPVAQEPRSFRVGDWLAEPTLNRLSSGSTVLRMRPQLMDVLVCLVRHQGQVVSKDTLLSEVWSDRYVTESGIVRVRG